MKRTIILIASLLAAGSVRADDAGRVDRFYLLGSIGPESALYLAEWLKTARTPEIVIDSPGGSMEASIAIVAALNARGGVRCRVRHLAASGAFAVLQACAVREIEPDAWLMTHEPRAIPLGAMERVRAAKFLADLEGLSKEWNALASRRLKMTAAEYDAKVRGRDWVLGPGEALRVGAVDSVVK